VPFGGWDPFDGRNPWRGSRRRRAAGRGDVRTAALALLAEQPLHGYQIIQEITERSGGTWRPSPGSVYPALQQLADEGLVRIQDADGRKVVHLTESGQTYVQAHREELDAVWNLATSDGDADVRTLFDLMRQVGFAAAQVARAGDASQVGKAHDILDSARRGLYRVLAGDDEPNNRPAGGPNAGE
jgi:DNA-binding PadR family transcriptional regulator